MKAHQTKRIMIHRQNHQEMKAMKMNKPIIMIVKVPTVKQNQNKKSHSIHLPMKVTRLLKRRLIKIRSIALKDLIL